MIIARSPVRLQKLTLLVAFSALLAPAAGMAQSDSTRSCEGLPVDSISVEASRPSFRGALAWWRKIARAFGLHHETTSAGLVRRFVSLDPGKPCTEFRRTESERILRAQPYLADATVRTTHVGDSVHVLVTTVDEVPAVGGARLRGSSLEALTIGTMNLMGAGIHLEGEWENGRVNRDGFGGKFSHSQLFGRPYSLTLEGARRPIGEVYSAAISHAFLTDLQRLAWHVGYVTSKDFARLRQPDRVELVQPLDRATWDVGGVLRVGPPRRLYLIGGMIMGERVVPRQSFSLVDSSTGELRPTPVPPQVRAYSSYDATSLAGVLGIRALTFTRMRALEALEAEQDVATGTQVGAIVGTQPFEGTLLSSGLLSADMYVGARSRRNFIGARAEAESRVDLRASEWRHLIASGRAAWYYTPRRWWTSELSLEAGAAWRTIIPFQLELGDRQGGVRGYARSHEAGAQRLVARVEQRFDMARYQGTRAAFGAALFGDAGRMWAGDVPFGVTSPIRASVGAAILAAIPARSQRTIRAELAVPLDRSLGARPELRFVVREPARGFWTDPPKVRWARLSTIPEQIFSWP